MPIMMSSNCPCCKDHLHHCEKCWVNHHNGEKDNDYIPPKYFGQEMFEGIHEIMEKKYGIKFIPSIKLDKNRNYKEGEYH